MFKKIGLTRSTILSNQSNLQPASTTVSETKTMESDEITLSAQANLLKTIEQTDPFIDQAKLLELKTAIKNGQYKIHYEHLAEIMWEDGEVLT